MKIAIIGSGISGLAAAYWLSRDHQVVVFESQSGIGGHTATVDIELDHRRYAIDTGFIVFNNRTYPNFNRLLDRLGVDYQPTEMSFSVSDKVNNFEYSGTNLNTLLAQRCNLVRRRFWRMVSEIHRFNRQAKADLAAGVISTDQTMAQYLDAGCYGSAFRQYYILPMASAIWSMPTKTINEFQALFFIRFFNHHGLLNIINRPQWYVIRGGSREYLAPLTAGFLNQIRASCKVNRLRRNGDVVWLAHEQGEERFDAVVFACHSDQALSILGDSATLAEHRILSDIEYCASDVVLHTDTAVLPRARRAWSSWNYLLTDKGNDVPLVTYNMNMLQGIKSPHTICVSLNARDQINPQRIIQTFSYAHPQLNARSIRAQQHWHEINAKNQTWFCGAYWGNGFHEDGVVSARRVVESIKQQTCQNIFSTAA